MSIGRDRFFAVDVGGVPGRDAKRPYQVGHAKPGQHTPANRIRGKGARHLKQIRRPARLAQPFAYRRHLAAAAIHGDSVAARAHVKQANGGQVCVLGFGDKVVDAVHRWRHTGQAGGPRHRRNGRKGRSQGPPRPPRAEPAKVGQLPL